MEKSVLKSLTFVHSTKWLNVYIDNLKNVNLVKKTSLDFLKVSK